LRWFICITLLFAGCKSYNPELPEIQIPIAWKENSPKGDDYVEKNRFWELFNDPVLNHLEEEALIGSFDLKIAASRIDEARSLISKDRAKRLPHVDLNASFIQDEMLLNPRNFGSPTNHLERVKQEQYSAFADFSYELDLWGKFKAKEESTKHQLTATKWEYEFVYQTLVTDVAVHYFALRTLKEEIDFVKQALCLWEDKVHLNQCRVQAGLQSAIDLSKSQLELALVQREMEELRNRYALEENALATLMGKPASSWKIPPGSLPISCPALPTILPSEILVRRADIQSALAKVAAGRSEVTVALRNYFPSFPLTTSLGLSTPVISHFFEWQARYWGYALNALEPLFDGGKRKADVKEAKARFSAYFANYQKTVNQAFKDVEDALSFLHYKGLQLDVLNKAAFAATDTYALAEEQFNSGLISYLLVADSKNSSISTERQIIALKGEQLIAWVRFMKAIGLQREG
jgi:multidrug efflux system outer membrane protein